MDKRRSCMFNCYHDDNEITRWSLLFRPLHSSLLTVTFQPGGEVPVSRDLDALYRGGDGEISRYTICTVYGPAFPTMPRSVRSNSYQFPDCSR